MRQRVMFGAVLLLLVVGGWLWLGPLSAWRSIDRVSFDPAAARAALAAQEASAPRSTTTIPNAVSSPIDGAGAAAPPTATPTSVPSTTAAPAPPPSANAAAETTTVRDLDVFLILGSDAHPADPDSKADAIMLFITPPSRAASMLVSIPRSLYVPSPCTGQPAPINVNLDGCGEVAGLDLIAVAIEDYTGLTIDHAVLFEFAGFQNIIDRIGGYEVCVDHAVKISPVSDQLLAAGCSVLDGSATLSWVRERKLLEEVDGDWQLMADAGDAGRTNRQRAMVRQIMAGADRFGSPGALLDLLDDLSGSLVLDGGLGLAEAVDLAWDLRRLGSRPAHDATIAATGTVSPDGELVQIPDGPFATYLEVFDDAG